MSIAATTQLPVAKNVSVHDVLLVSMPFGPLFQPSIGLSLLKGVLEVQQVDVAIKYLTIKFAEKIGVKRYHDISNGNPYVDLAGEWLFSDYLFEGNHPLHHQYVDDVLRRQSPRNSRRAVVPEKYIDVLLYVKDFVPDFIDTMVNDVLQHNPKVIGFTSTFQQHVPSLCLAKAIKKRAPNIMIVMGGANCEGMMGLETVRQFPFLDAVVSGEGEVAFQQMITNVLAGKSVDMIQGVYTYSNVSFLNINGEPLGAAPVNKMDTLPIPDYHDFFQQVADSSLIISSRLRVLLETSRGCWWGEHHHCTFCGLNGADMSYRSKSPERAFDELMALMSTYPTSTVWVVDNILDMNYFDSFLPALAQEALELDMFYEVKANLRKDQLKLLAQAGIRNLQPGIESLSDNVLKLMSKGVSWLQNVQLLKWARELGIKIHWNMLWGFPGENPEDYAQMEAIVPLLHHLDPPTGSARIRLDRFSPNFNEAHDYGFVNVRPAIPYAYIYPFPEEVLTNLAYHFFYDYTDNRDIASYTRPLFKKLKEWSKRYPESALFMVDLKACLLIWDLRDIASQALYSLTGRARQLYLECDQIRSPRQLKQQMQTHGDESSEDEIINLLHDMVKQNIVLNDNARYLALAITVDIDCLSSDVLLKLKHIIQSSDIIDSREMEDTELFGLNAEGKPIVNMRLLHEHLGTQIIAQLTQPSYELIAGILIDA